MPASAADAVSNALPALVPALQGSAVGSIDLGDLRTELEQVAQEALTARLGGLGLDTAVVDPRFPMLSQLHRDLRDALFLEIPTELRGWVEDLRDHRTSAEDLGNTLTRLARSPTTLEEPPTPLDEGATALEATDLEATDLEAGTPAYESAALQAALSEVLIFESVRLRLLGLAWSSEDFERLGGDEDDVDAIAWEEVTTWLHASEVDHPDVRPLQLMWASAAVNLARDTAERASELRLSDADTREELGMRAKLRAALRELRLPESVLLENALSSLLGQERLDLHELQEHRPLALEGLSRQAMDQRVSRGRRALTRTPQSWPRRRNTALFDLLRQDQTQVDE